MTLVHLIQIVTLLFFLGGIICLYMGLHIRRKILKKTKYKEQERKELHNGSVPFKNKIFQETKGMNERLSKIKKYNFDDKLSIIIK